MRRPIIKVALILIILAGIYFVLPFSFGIVAQRYSFSFLRHENETLGKVLGIHLDFAEYNRGWFSSTAVLQIERKSADGAFEIVKKIPITIKHGPTYRVENRFKTGFGVIMSQTLPLRENSPYEITFRENIGFNGERGVLLLFSNKADAAMPGDLKIGSLQLRINSNLPATQFLFSLDGHDLQFQDLQKSLTASVKEMNATLEASYIGERHWKLTFGVGLGDNQLSATLPDQALTPITVTADRIDLSHLHVDTQQFANLLAEVVQLKQATDAQQPVQPTAWMALPQQFLTQIIKNDTWVVIKGLAVQSPMGKIQLHYDASFPTLPEPHDYFDVATRNVGTLQIQVPNWKYVDPKTNAEFALSNFQYVDYNNTVFARHSKMTLGAFDIKDTKEGKAITPILLAGFSYDGELHGDVRSLSQTMQWQLARLCFMTNCFDQAEGKFELLNMNYDAFRDIATATRKVVQYNPKDPESMSARWTDLGNAYMKLISPETQLTVSHQVMTPAGQFQLHGEMTWPNLKSDPTVTPTFSSYMKQAVYELRLLFPAMYVTSFLENQRKQEVTEKEKAVAAEKKEPAFEMQAAQFLQYALEQGYLKKVGDSYVMDMTGKGAVMTINGVTWKAPG